MSHPDLLSLLRGELATDAVLAADDHLAGCAECRTELVEIATAHAVLTRAAQVVDLDHASVPPMLPPAPQRRRAGRVAVACGVAAALVVGGALAVRAVRDRDDRSEGGAAAYATADLTPLGPRATRAVGHVEMVAEDAVHTRVTVETGELPTLREGRFYYAWLLDPTTQKMLPLGQVGPSGAATFELDDALLAAYAAVDVSLEEDDGDPAHSATSVLRGTYDRSRPAGG